MNAEFDIKKIADDRGWLAELVNSSFGTIGHVYVTTCLPGVVKAWHKHNHQTDRFILLSGRLLVGLCNESITRSVVMLPFHKMLIIHPGVWHGFTAIGNDEAVVLNCTDRPYDPQDEIRLPFDSFNFNWKPVSR
jgi:dTDP-4-dehydrorhamnose 3,5-epimerase